jgi:hypothetical protein
MSVNQSALTLVYLFLFGLGLGVGFGGAVTNRSLRVVVYDTPVGSYVFQSDAVTVPPSPETLPHAPSPAEGFYLA